MVRRQRANNQASTTLNGGITDSATSLVVTSATGWPTEGDFFAAINAEIVLVTNVSGTTWTVIRGQAGTTAAAQSNGATVIGNITADEFENRLKDYGQKKALAYGVITKDDGSIVTSSDFTLINGTGSSLEDPQDGIIRYVSRTHTGDDSSGMNRPTAAVSPTNKRFTCHFECPAFVYGSGGDYISFYQRQNTGGTMSGISLYPDNSVRFQTRSTYLNVPTNLVTHGAAGRRDIWCQLDVQWDVVASTDYLTWRYSWDGVHWFQIYQETFAASSLSPGIWMTSRNLANCHVHLLSWHEEQI